MNSKSKTTAFLLCYFLGILGVHRFYLNKTLSGILMLVTGGGLGIWWLIDIFLIAKDRMQDHEGGDLYIGPPNPDKPNAGFWVRVAAMSIDGILIQLFILIFIMLPALAAMLLGIIGSSEAEQQSLSGIISVLWILISVLYFALPLARQHQATPGKRCFGIHVTTRNGEPVGVLRALWRTLSYALSTLPLLLGFIMAGFKNKRALHDLLAGTQVLYVASSDSGQLNVAEPEAITEVAAVADSDTDSDGDSTATRGPVLMMVLGLVLLLAAGALALL